MNMWASPQTLIQKSPSDWLHKFLTTRMNKYVNRRPDIADIKQQLELMCYIQEN